MKRKTKKQPARARGRPAKAKKRRASPKMVIRRNVAPAPAPATTAPRNVRRKTSPPRQPVGYRVQQMGGSHVAAGLGAGTLGNLLGVIAVGKGWIGPKATAGILMGTGAAAGAAGWYWDADHVMAAGTGLAAAGTFSMANQLAVDMYVAAEKKAKEKKAEREQDEQAKRLEEARKLIAEEAATKPRNAPQFRVVEVARPPDDDEADEEVTDEDNDYDEADAA